METIIFKAPVGTKKKLASIAARSKTTVSELMRQQAQQLLTREVTLSAHEKVRHLCGSIEIPKGAATGKEYLKQYAKLRH